jgi:hypothetical protein
MRAFHMSAAATISARSVGVASSDLVIFVKLPMPIS